MGVSHHAFWIQQDPFHRSLIFLAAPTLWLTHLHLQAPASEVKLSSSDVPAAHSKNSKNTTLLDTVLLRYHGAWPMVFHTTLRYMPRKSIYRCLQSHKCLSHADYRRPTGLFAGQRLSSGQNTKDSASSWKSGTLSRRWSFHRLTLLMTTIERRLAEHTIWL